MADLQSGTVRIFNTVIEQTYFTFQRKRLLSFRAEALNNVGFLFYSQNNLEKSVENFLLALSIYEEVGNVTGISTIYNNLGAIYGFQGDVVKSLEYYGKALEINNANGHGDGKLRNLKQYCHYL